MKSQAVAGLLLMAGLNGALAQSPAPPNPGPIQAEFIKALDIRHAAPGDIALAKVTVDWNGPGCVLRRGATIEATVEQFTARNGDEPSKLALSFKRAQCSGKVLVPMELILAAVAGPPDTWRAVPNTRYSVPSALGGGVPGQDANRDFYYGTDTSPRVELNNRGHRFPITPSLRPGDVIEIPDLKLTVSPGPGQPSVLTSAKNDVGLKAYTQLLLAPAALAYAPAAPPQPAPSPTPR